MKSLTNTILPPSLVGLIEMRIQRPSGRRCSPAVKLGLEYVLPPSSSTNSPARVFGEFIEIGAGNQPGHCRREKGAQPAVDDDEPAVRSDEHHAFVGRFKRVRETALRRDRTRLFALDHAADTVLHDGHRAQQDAGFVIAAFRDRGFKLSRGDAVGNRCRLRQWSRDADASGTM